MKKTFPKVKTNTSNFNFGYRVEGYAGDLIDDPRIFVYDFSYVEMVADANGIWSQKSKFELEMEACSIKHFDNDTLNHFKLYNYKCLINNYTFGGDWGSDFIAIPSFYIRR